MSNWFEQNPAKSVIAHTILVAGVTWAVTRFVLVDSTVQGLRSQLDSVKAQSEQYQAKSDLLLHDIAILREENREYRSWLAMLDDSVPTIVPTIVDLKQQLAEFENRTTAAVPVASSPQRENFVQLGRAYINDDLGVIVTLLRTTPSRQADIQVQLPSTDSPISELVNPGKRWSFSKDGVDYILTITEISFITDTVNFTVSRN